VWSDSSSCLVVYCFVVRLHVSSALAIATVKPSFGRIKSRRQRFAQPSRRMEWANYAWSAVIDDQTVGFGDSRPRSRVTACNSDGVDDGGNVDEMGKLSSERMIAAMGLGDMTTVTMGIVLLAFFATASACGPLAKTTLTFRRMRSSRSRSSGMRC